MADFLTYKNIYEEVERAVKVTKGSKQTLIKELINMVLWELLSADDLFPIFWLRDFDDSLGSKAPSVISGFTAADPGVITTVAAHGLEDGDVVGIHSIVGMVEANNRIFQVGTCDDATHFDLEDLEGADVDASGYTAYTSDGVVNHMGRKLDVTDKNVERIIQATLFGYDPMAEMTPLEMEGSAIAIATTARPTRYMQRKKYTSAGVETNHIIWAPGSDAAYDLRYWFESRVSPLSADGDVPLLPPRFHQALVAGTVTRLLELGIQAESPAIWPVLYKQHLTQLVLFNRKYYTDHEDAFRAAPYLTG